jgi:hypothetical protein
MAATNVSGGDTFVRIASRVYWRSRRHFSPMKTKAARRPLVTKSRRTAPSQRDSRAGATDSLSRPQPFLVQALRLRTRRPAR